MSVVTNEIPRSDSPIDAVLNCLKYGAPFSGMKPDVHFVEEGERTEILLKAKKLPPGRGIVIVKASFIGEEPKVVSITPTIKHFGGMFFHFVTVEMVPGTVIVETTHCGHQQSCRLVVCITEEAKSLLRRSSKNDAILATNFRA